MSDQELIAKQEHVWDTIATLCTPFTEREMLASGKVRIAGDRALAGRIVAQMNFMP